MDNSPKLLKNAKQTLHNIYSQMSQYTPWICTSTPVA